MSSQQPGFMETGPVRLSSLEELAAYRSGLDGRPLAEKTVHVCMTTGCRAGGAEGVRATAQREIDRLGLGSTVALRETGCRGFCARGPVVVVEPEGIFYQLVEPGDVPEIIERTVMHGEVVERLNYSDAAGVHYAHMADIPFFAGQERIVLRNCGSIDPTDIDAFIARDGYAALAKVSRRHEARRR